MQRFHPKRKPAGSMLPAGECEDSVAYQLTRNTSCAVRAPLCVLLIRPNGVSSLQSPCRCSG